MDTRSLSQKLVSLGSSLEVDADHMALDPKLHLDSTESS